MADKKEVKEKDVKEKDVKEKEGKSDFIKMVGIGLIVLVIALGASYVLFSKMIQSAIPQNDKNETQNAHEVGEIIKLDEFITNINNGGKYVKMKVSIEIASEDEKVKEKVNSFMPVIRDSILEIISDKMVSDFDYRNRDNLKKEIRDSINTRLGSEQIRNVYFEDIIIQ
ncbi:MAG: flagellar basal body-associated FliL family protein [Syntrophomonadaceae bacterium]|nr:flagellar basal body-associated FliL family protein [Syntrophomonadaceae bacterium]